MPLHWVEQVGLDKNCPMPFFDAPDTPPIPEPGPEEPYVPPIWTGPSELVLGGVVPFQVLLARTEQVAVVAEHFVAYPSGLSFSLTILSRDVVPPEMRLGWPRVEMVRLGVQFSDGRKATNVGAAAGFGCPKDEQGIPTVPVLLARGGSGHDRRWELEHWLWPLPPPGPLGLVIEWPMVGIAETRHQVDAAPILEAAGRAVTLWDSARAHPRPTAAGARSTLLTMRTAASKPGRDPDSSES